MSDERNTFLRDMQSLIDFLGAHPELPLPDSFAISVYNLGTESLNRAKEIAKSLGTFEKSVNNQFLDLTKTFGQVSIRFVFYRHNVCTKRVIGTKTETKMVPAPSAPMVEKVVKTEVVEWDCPTLLGETDEATAAPEVEAPSPPVDDDEIPY